MNEPIPTPQPVAPLLSYAPPARSANREIYVLLLGLLTCIITLTILHFIQAHVETDIMSFTVKLIIPLGAIIVGLCAGLGFGLGTYLLGVRARVWLILTMGLCLLVSYFLAHYIEFVAEGPLYRLDTKARVGFWEYYHVTTISMTTVDRYNKNAQPEELGMTGYFYRGLGVVGFVLGGLIVPLVLRQKTYCDLCQRYMTSKDVFTMPAADNLAAMRMKRSFTLDTPEHKSKIEHAVDVLKKLHDAILAGQYKDFTKLRKTHRAKIPGRTPLAGVMRLHYCPNCHQGEMITSLRDSNNMQTGISGILDTERLSPEMMKNAVEASK